MTQRRAVIYLALALAACGADRWQGFVYVNKSDLTKHIELGYFDTLEQCRNAAQTALFRIAAPTDGDYECGLNCETRASFGELKVCDKTER